MTHLHSNWQWCRRFIAAALILVGGSPTLQGATPARLPALVRETSEQFQIAYRLQPMEGQHRQQQLNAVVAAWRAAPRTDTNDERLNAWLRLAIRASMPGSREELPPTPRFVAMDGREMRPVEPTPTDTPATKPIPAPTQVTDPVWSDKRTVQPTTANKDKPAASTEDKSVDDPFRDDPADEPEEAMPDSA
jgi:hypothetical protein